MELFQSRCKDSEGQRGCLHFSYSEVGARILKPEHGGLQMFSGVTSVKPLPEIHLNKWKDTYGNTWKHMEYISEISEPKISISKICFRETSNQ